jgi:hypothetical protein
MERLKRNLVMGMVSGGLLLGLNTAVTPAHADGWTELAKPLVQQVLIPGLTKGIKIWQENRKKDEASEQSVDITVPSDNPSVSWDVPPPPPTSDSWEASSSETETSPPPLSNS